MDSEEWVIWNGSMGVLDMVRIGLIEGQGPRMATLAAPYDVVGPFSLDDLETCGRIVFGECLVMSRERWQLDQTGLRQEAWEKRRSHLLRFERTEDDEEARSILGLSPSGPLQPNEINGAFRKRAKEAHPDSGGSNEAYQRISEARDILLTLFE